MRIAELIVLAVVALGIGWLMATGWQSLIASLFTDIGATVITSSPDALPTERIGVTLITGLSVLVSVLITRIAERMTGRCIWPVWGIFLALLIGENLGIGLRLVTIATVTLPAAVDMAVGGTPVIDLAAADLIAWALAGLASAAVVCLGLVVVMGQPQE
ncbi:MAG: hypothetical protein ACI8RZ_005744 [Myxococcota bacterium]|jgi:hypothetical protein